MEGYKLKDLKLKEFDSIKEMFDRALKRVNAFEDFRTELVKGKEKRVGEELVQKITKKQKVEDDKEKSKLKQLMETIPDEEEVAIDAIPLAVKSQRIVDWKIHKEEKKSYYQIAKKESSDEYAMTVKDFKKFLRRRATEGQKLKSIRRGILRVIAARNMMKRLKMKHVDVGVATHKEFYNSLGNVPNRCSVAEARLEGCYRSLGE
uniref:Uncharacterized protein n=1 Tax=Tanacetum cinerariifolium TaxID=118510 RepID=A0A6L2LPU3_TANCI|nr:hypothetical protein [Tanacetum cinerariifolium]